MYKIQIIIFLILISSISFAQEKGKTTKSKGQINVQFKESSWDFKPGKVEFIDDKSESAIKIYPSAGKVILKDLVFENGTIEYDMTPLDSGFFTGIYFRWNSALENEYFYFRTELAGDASAIDAIQYAPFIDGVNMWDMLFHYQANARFRKNESNHVKLVISGKQMKAYVNDMNVPSLVVTHLEGNVSKGNIAFDGHVKVSNLIIKSNEVEGLSPLAGVDPTINDNRFIRSWNVSEPITPDKKVDLHEDYFPAEGTKWENIVAECQGMVNLTRKFGKSEGRRIVWLKTKIVSNANQEKKFNLGFSDEVWVMINNKPVYVDKNPYFTPMMKKPEGRLSIENTSFNLPLQEGDNELIIGVGNFFYGWGIVARFDDLKGVTLQQ